MALEEIKNQPKSIKGKFPENTESNKVKNEIDKIKRPEKIIRDNLFYEANKEIYDFKNLKTVRAFGESIYK